MIDVAARKKPTSVMAAAGSAVAPKTPSGLIAMLLGDARSDEDFERLRVRFEASSRRRGVTPASVHDLRALSRVVERVADAIFVGGEAELAAVLGLHDQLMPLREKKKAAAKWIAMSRRFHGQPAPTEFGPTILWGGSHSSEALRRSLTAYDRHFAELSVESIEHVLSQRFADAKTVAILAVDCGAFGFERFEGDYDKAAADIGVNVKR